MPVVVLIVVSSCQEPHNQRDNQFKQGPKTPVQFIPAFEGLFPDDGPEDFEYLSEPEAQAFGRRSAIGVYGGDWGSVAFLQPVTLSDCVWFTGVPGSSLNGGYFGIICNGIHLLQEV